jgi:hypothetical protein
MEAVAYEDGSWNVDDENGNKLAGPFDSEREAYEWIDENCDD